MLLSVFSDKPQRPLWPGVTNLTERELRARGSSFRGDVPGLSSRTQMERSQILPNTQWLPKARKGRLEVGGKELSLWPNS